MDTVRCDGDARSELEHQIETALATLQPVTTSRLRLSPRALAALAVRTLWRPSRDPSLAEAEAELQRLSRRELARWLRAAARVRRAHDREHCVACAMADLRAGAASHAELDALPALEPWMLRAGLAEELQCAAADGWPIEPALLRLCARVQSQPVCEWPDSARLARWAQAIDLREWSARRELRGSV